MPPALTAHCRRSAPRVRDYGRITVTRWDYGGDYGDSGLIHHRPSNEYAPFGDRPRFDQLELDAAVDRLERRGSAAEPDRVDRKAGLR